MRNSDNYGSVARFFGQPQADVVAQNFLVLQRSDIFNAANMRNNVAHIIRGRVPRVGDELINVHHIGQNPLGPFVEITATQNRYTFGTGGPLHIPGPSRVQHGTLWNNFRQEYFARRLLQAVENGTVPRSLFDRYLRESIEQGRRINPFLQ